MPSYRHQPSSPQASIRARFDQHQFGIFTRAGGPISSSNNTRSEELRRTLSEKFGEFYGKFSYTLLYRRSKPIPTRLRYRADFPLAIGGQTQKRDSSVQSTSATAAISRTIVSSSRHTASLTSINVGKQTNCPNGCKGLPFGVRGPTPNRNIRSSRAPKLSGCTAVQSTSTLEAPGST